MKKISIIIISILFVISCKSGNKTKVITVNNKYSVELPAFLDDATKVLDKDELNEDASLQYVNTWKEFDIVIIDETKSEFQESLETNNLTKVYANNLNGYSRSFLDFFPVQGKIIQKPEIKDTIINNLPAKLISLKSQYDEDMSIYFSIGIIQGKNTYYQIVIWTLAGYEYKYKNKMKKIIYSFKEL